MHLVDLHHRDKGVRLRLEQDLTHRGLIDTIRHVVVKHLKLLAGVCNHYSTGRQVAGQSAIGFAIRGSIHLYQYMFLRSSTFHSILQHLLPCAPARTSHSRSLSVMTGGAPVGRARARARARARVYVRVRGQSQGERTLGAEHTRVPDLVDVLLPREPYREA